MSFELSRPEWLAALVPVVAWWWWVRRGGAGAVLVGRLGPTARSAAAGRWGALLWGLPTALRTGALACLVLALAGPNLLRFRTEAVSSDVALAFAVDLSTSMWAEDMGIGTSRLDAAKATVDRFLAERPGETGLVVFAGESLLRLPLTEDSHVTRAAVDALQVGLLIDGTDISGAIATGAALLSDAPHPSKVLVLVTDGAHNQEGLLPAEAARAAALVGVRIYPVAIGREQPIRPGQAADFETVLRQSARITGGAYYRAVDATALDSIQAEIGRLESGSPDEIRRAFATPVASWLLAAAAALLASALVLRASRWGVLP